MKNLLIFILFAIGCNAYISGLEFDCQLSQGVTQPVEPVLERVLCDKPNNNISLCNVTFGYRYCDRCSLVVPYGPFNNFGYLGENLGQPTKFYPGYTRNAFTLYNITRKTALYWSVQSNQLDNGTFRTEGTDKVQPDSGKVLEDKGVVPEALRICTRACAFGEDPTAYSTNPLYVPQYISAGLRFVLGIPANASSTPKSALPDQNAGITVCNAQALNGTKFLVLGGCGGVNETHGMATGVAIAAWEDGADVTVTSRFPGTGAGDDISEACSYVKPGIKVFKFPVEMARKTTIDYLFQHYTELNGGPPDNVFVGVGMNSYGPYILQGYDRVKEFYTVDHIGPEEIVKQAGLRMDAAPNRHIMAITSTAARFFIGGQGAYSPAKAALDRSITLLDVEREMAVLDAKNQRTPAAFFSIMPGAIATDIGRRDWAGADRVPQNDDRVVGTNHSRLFGFSSSPNIMSVREFGLRVIETFHAPAETLQPGIFVYQETPTSTDNSFVRLTLNATTLPTRKEQIKMSARIFSIFFPGRTYNKLSDVPHP